MGRQVPPDQDRVKAVTLALRELVEKHGSQNAASEATGLSQQHISKVLSSGRVGIEFADKVAALYETTVDGLVAEFLGGGKPVRAGNIRGWDKAVAEARADDSSEYPWELAADIILPLRPNYATKGFVLALARLLKDYASVSRTQISARKAGS